MKRFQKVLLSLLAAALFPLAGCVAYEPAPAYGPGHDAHHNRDRDGDGVRNRDDRAPDNPRRY